MDWLGHLKNANKLMINDLTLIRNIAIFHCCHWNKGIISNSGLVTGFLIMEPSAPDSDPTALHSSSWMKESLRDSIRKDSMGESAFQVARQTFEVIYPQLKYLVFFFLPCFLSLFIYFISLIIYIYIINLSRVYCVILFCWNLVSLLIYHEDWEHIPADIPWPVVVDHDIN